MAKVNNTDLYPLENLPTLLDFLLGTKEINGKTKNFSLNSIIQLINGVNGKNNIQFKFSDGTDEEINYWTKGVFFTENIETNPLNFTKLIFNKQSLQPIDLTLLFERLLDLENVVVKLDNPENPNNFFNFIIKGITDQIDYFVFDIEIFENFFFGELLNEAIYSVYFDIKTDGVIQDNIKKEILISCPDIISNTVFANIINQLQSFTVLETEIPTFKAVSNALIPIVYYVELLNTGKGNYGIGGTTLTASNIKVTSSGATSTDISDLPTTQTISLGYTGTDVVIALNSQIPNLIIQDQNDGYVIIKGIFELGIFHEYLWIGTGGTYGGAGGSQCTALDFKEISAVASVIGKAKDNYSGTVKTDIYEVDPVVYTKYTVDTKLNDKADKTYVDTQDLAKLNEAKAYADSGDSQLKGGELTYDNLKKIADELRAQRAIIGGTTADGDSVVNTVNELLAVMATFPEGVDLVTLFAGKVSTTDIYNALDCIVAGKVADARQVKVLNDLITTLRTDLTANTTAIGLRELSSNKSQDIETDKTSTSKFGSVKAFYDWCVGRFQPKLVAGTNVTIDNTNPLAPVISASGGAGSNPTVQTIIVDGVNTENWEIITRDIGLAFPVPSVRPTGVNKNIAFDIMPNGTPGEFGNNGYAWFDVSNKDIKDSNPPLNAARVGNRSIGIEFGSQAFGGASAIPVFFNLSKDSVDNIPLWLNVDKSIEMRGYGLGTKEVSDLFKTASNYVPRFATDGTLIEELDINVKSKTSTEPTGSDAILNMVSLTQAEYDAGIKVATTLYIIV